MEEKTVASQEPMEQDKDDGTALGKDDIMLRVRQYLKKSKDTAAPADNAGEEKKFMEKILGKGVAGTYSAIQKNKSNSLQAPNLNGMGHSKGTDTGSFFNAGNLRMANAHFRTNFSKNLNVSFSFDPATLTCFNCGGGSHKVVGSAVGGGGGVVLGPTSCLIRPSPRSCLTQLEQAAWQ